MKLRHGILSGLVMLGLAVSPAFAADKGGLEIPSIDNASKPFSGGYIGGFVAYPTQTTTIGGLVDFDASDLCYGGTLGYDIRWTGTNIVTGLKGSGSICNVGNALVDSDRHWDVLARVGFVIGQTTLLYGAAGYYNDGTGFTFAPPPGLSLPDKGLALGLGIESYMTKNLTVNAEVLRVDNGSSAGGMLEASTWVPRVGLNWRF